jgi:hypothetical protein
MYFLLHYKIENPKKDENQHPIKKCQIMNSILSNKNNQFLNSWPLTANPLSYQSFEFLVFLLEYILQDDILIESKFTQW